MYKIFITKSTNTKEILNKVLNKYSIKSDIIYNEYGKPYLENNELYFNLSNSGEYSVCAISDSEIGIDIQKIILKNKIIDKICTDEEKKLIKNEEDFTNLWVKKESYIKYLGIGLSYGLKNVDTLKIKTIKTIKYKEYYIGICSNDFLKEDLNERISIEEV